MKFESHWSYKLSRIKVINLISVGLKIFSLREKIFNPTLIKLITFFDINWFNESIEVIKFYWTRSIKFY